MASRLCECRQPDMVDQLIKNVGPSKAMPAIQELFATNSSAIEAMPASTLCQFLQYDLQRRRIGKTEEGSAVHTIVSRVKAAFADDSVQDDCVSAVLFLLDRRTAFNIRERLGAKLVLTILFADQGEAMELDQGVEGVWMEGLMKAPFYPKVASCIVTQLAKAAMDSEGAQLDCLLSAIRDQIDEENMHQLSILLASLVEKFGKISAEKALPLLEVFRRYVDACTSSPNAWPAEGFPASASRKPVLKYTVEINKKKRMLMTADAVEALLRLLCYTSSKQNDVYKGLAEIFLPDKGSMPKVTCDGEIVDLLTPKLRAFMLEFDNEKIVKIAMGDLDPQLALKVACEMSAMRPEHASKLLEVACGGAGLTKNDVMSLDKTARLMLNIHNIHGIKHAKKVLSLMDELEKSGEEKMEMNIFHASPLKPTKIIEPPPTKPMNRAEMVQHLKAATVFITLLVPGAPFVLGWDIWRDTQRAEDVAMAVVEHLEGNLKFFLGDREAFNYIFAVLGPCAKKFPSVKNRLSTFSAKVLKSAATSPAIEGHLRQYVPNAPTPVKKKKELTDEEILEALYTKNIPAGFSRAILLNKFLQRRIEIFARVNEPGELEAQMLAIFGGPGIEELVAQMPRRTPLETIEKVLLKLLSAFNPKYNPHTVCIFFSLNAIREFCRVWTPPQWACLARYVVEMVMKDPQQMKMGVDLIEHLVDLTNVEVAVPIAEVIVTLARSDLPVEQRKHAQNLLDEIQNKYPCKLINSPLHFLISSLFLFYLFLVGLFVDKLANRASIQGVRWRQRDTDGLVTTLVAQAVNPNTDCSDSVRTLTQFVETYPRVMIRNYGTMAQQIPLLTRMPSGLRKEVMPFVVFVLDATLSLLNKFLQRRIEIFARVNEPGELEAQMLAIFGGPGIEELVAQMPRRTPLETIEKVLLKLLSAFNPKYNPHTVCIFFSLNAIREFCRVWAPPQWACLARYVVEMVMKDPQQMKMGVDLIEHLVDLTNVEVAVPIAEVIVTLARSDLPVEQRKHAQNLLDEIQNKYPCLFVDKLANRASIQGVRWRQRDTDGLVTTLVAQAVNPNTDCSDSVRTLTQFVETYPRVMIRNYGTMAQQIPLLTRMPSGLRKLFFKLIIIDYFL
ncbi:hypothetical protein OESDEN_10247 [Oesophagostomum dentatum]|uniref:Integrator complex subunit 1 INTS2-binding domain-containing protein n=1 Tax=Oesophagostomum dentatum TaxID=61180 RepID=A0A0B1SY56_OESDE|nr:hypothetical protein OESDEN_10247 [Oesophagostomum dentatum]